MAEDKYISSYTGNEIDRAISVSIFEQVETAGAGITFEKSKIYNSPDDPTYGEIVQSLDGAVVGTVQKIYHQDSSKPTFPDNWVNIGGGDYVDDEINIIYAYYISDDRIEYQINDFLLESNIDHNSLKNYVENKHINHADINLYSGEGLSGGGTIDRNRTLNLRLVVKNDGSVVSSGYSLDFNKNINAVDNDDRTFTIDVPDDLTVISNYNTNDLSEGSNHLYFTTTRVDDHLSGDDGINYDAGSISVDSTVVRDSDSDVSENDWVLDEDDFSSNSNTKVATQQSIKSYVKEATSGITSTSKSISSNYTPNPNELLFCDTSGGSFTVDLPSTDVEDGDRVIIIDSSGSFGDNSLTINRNGNNIDGQDSDLILDLSWVITSFIYSETYGWFSDFGGAYGSSYSGPKQPQKTVEPDDCVLDDTNTATSHGNAFDVIKSINFDSGSDGSVWITTSYQGFTDYHDILLDIYYVLDTDDADTQIDLLIELWYLNVGSGIDTSNPDETSTHSINVEAGDNDILKVIEGIVTIDNSNLPFDHLVVKLTREGESSSDDYSGVFKTTKFIVIQ